jgi:CarboxypepD_reg-like domain
MKNLCFTLTFTLLCLFTKAQSQVSGKLIDDKKEGLAFANILLHKSDSSLYKGALTDDAGAFSFEEVTNGSYFISIQYVGFNKYFSPILEINKKM